jgi:hypothetical protein
MWSNDVVATSIGLVGDLKLGQYLKVKVISVKMLARDSHGVLERFLPVPCFLVKFGGQLLVSPQIDTVDVWSLTLSIATAGCIVDYGGYRGELTLSSGVDGLLYNLVVMVSITGSQREILLKPMGNNIWSGQQIQSLNSNAITWSLAKQLYGPSGPYFVVPFGIFIGFAVTFVHWLISKVNEQIATCVV